MLAGITMEVKPHSLKEATPTDVTLLGMVTDVNPWHPVKASMPISFTLLGIVTDVNPLKPRKVRELIDVTPFGIIKSFTSFPFKYKCSA